MSNNADTVNPSFATIDWHSLHELLSADKKTTEALISALNNERDLLTSRNYEALVLALEEKSFLIQQLGNRSQARQNFLNDAGFQTEKDLLTLAEKKQPSIANAWRELATLWQQCQKQNQVNEQIVRRTRTVIQGVLEILRGQPDLGRTYNPKGETYKAYSSKTIASA